MGVDVRETVRLAWWSFFFFFMLPLKSKVKHFGLRCCGNGRSPCINAFSASGEKETSTKASTVDGRFRERILDRVHEYCEIIGVILAWRFVCCGKKLKFDF